MPFERGDDEHSKSQPRAGQNPSKRDGKLVRRNEPNELHDCKSESTNLMDASILHHIDIPPLGIGCVYMMSIDGSMLHGSGYDVTIECYLACTCIGFVFLLSSSIIKKGKYVPCKLLYFIFAKKMSWDLKVDIFIHEPTLSWNEVYCRKIKYEFLLTCDGHVFSKTMLLETIYIYIKCC
jgi:hypothetical protein